LRRGKEGGGSAWLWERAQVKARYGERREECQLWREVKKAWRKWETHRERKVMEGRTKENKHEVGMV
jgi:hypothetical protein